MAQRGYPGIHAGVPTTQCLRSAVVVNGARRSKAKAKVRRPYSRPVLAAGLGLPVGAGLLAKASAHPIFIHCHGWLCVGYLRVCRVPRSRCANPRTAATSNRVAACIR